MPGSSPCRLRAGLGIPGLGLNLAGNASLNLGWDFQLGFGLNKTDGFYINSSQYNATTNPYPTSFNISTDVTLPGLAATGTLGYLQLKAADDDKQPTNFQGAFAITLTDPGESGVVDQHVTFSKIAAAGFSNVVNVGFTANAAVNLDLSTNFVDASGKPDSGLPSLSTIFRLDWPFSATTMAGISTSVPSITFDQVKINLGSFLNNFARPILTDAQQVLAPIQPVINVLMKPIPALSELAGHDVTLATLASQFGNNNTANFINAVVSLNNLINSLPAPGSNMGIMIDLGSFTVSGSAAKDPTQANKMTPQPLSAAALAAIKAKMNQEVSTAVPGFSSIVNQSATTTGGGFQFPILKNPLQAFQLLLGNDDGATPLSLFQWNLPTLTLNLSYTQTFRVPSLPVLAAQLSGRSGARQILVRLRL